MPAWPHLSKAPIVEGLIDLRVEPGPEASLSAIATLGDQAAATFPSREEMYRREVELALGPKVERVISRDVNEPIGLILRSIDKKRVVQFRLDGFTYSILRPYTNWEDLRNSARDLWSRYRHAIQPARVTRIAVRFINRMPIIPGESLDKTFATTFVLASTLPQSVAGFLLRLVVPFETDESVAILSQTLDPDGPHCIFDIDVFSERARGFEEEDVWTKFEVLRELKNRLFIQSLNPAALEALR